MLSDLNSLPLMMDGEPIAPTKNCSCRTGETNLNLSVSNYGAVNSLVPTNQTDTRPLAGKCVK